MPTITIEEAQVRLRSIIETLVPGEALIITRDDQHVAELRPLPTAKPQSNFGICKGMLTILEDDDQSFVNG